MSLQILLIVTLLAWPCATVAQVVTAKEADAVARQESVAVVEQGMSEWMITAGPGWGVSLLHSVPGHRYVLPSVSWGRVLTGPLGPGVLRGRFAWALEVIPAFGQFAPQDTYGVGVTPLVWRWNFEPRASVAAFAELAGGGLWTRDPVPERTTGANFTAHAAYGLRYFVRPGRALVIGYRFHHISNGNRLERNPGVNAHVLQVGVSLLR